MDIRQLFQRHYPSLVRFLYARLGDRDLAEDLAQEAFVRLLRRPPRDPEGWLYVVASNLARDAARGEVRRSRHLEVLTGERAEDAMPSPEQQALLAEDAARVRTTLAALSERDRTLLVLCADGLSYREIAGAIGVAPSSVAPLLARAQRRFFRAHAEGGGRGDDVDQARASG